MQRYGKILRYPHVFVIFLYKNDGRSLLLLPPVIFLGVFLFNNNLPSVVDVDAGTGGHSVEFTTGEVVPVVIPQVSWHTGIVDASGNNREGLYHFLAPRTFRVTDQPCQCMVSILQCQRLQVDDEPVRCHP